MLAQQRRAYILEQVRLHGALRVSELVERLGVSDMTVRRDLTVLSRQGLADKVHGGVTAPQESSTAEPAFADKSLLQPENKQAIAMRAARLIRPGSAIGLSAGSTTWVLAQHLGEIADLTVVTNSLPIAEVLHHTGHPTHSVVITGGIRTPSDALVGPLALRSLRSLHLDTVVMGAHGIDPRSGLSTPNLMEAETNEALVAAGRRLIVIADHTKWGVIGISTFAALGQVDVLVTDGDMPQANRDRLSDHIGQLLIAPPRAATPHTDADHAGRQP